ncbi:MAG TPA: BON domain-containing protein [Gammaproteobacteria bacterium]
MDANHLAKHLRSALEHEPRVNLHRDRVEVQLMDGVATVTGEVDDIAGKRRTLELAASLLPVNGIVDRLHVRPVEPMGDGAIADHVEQALLRDSAFDECSLYRKVRGAREKVRTAADTSWWIEVGVEDGVVTLDGEVPSLSHKRFAGVLAWWVPGCRDVVNGLGVEPAEDDNDLEILDALRIVLEKDPLVDASQVTASAHDAVVTLDGFVASEASRHAAEYDAWALFGVDDVVNRIRVQGD